MPYGETKVYFDGSHYIAIPHTTRNVRKKYKPPEETITVIQEEESTPTNEVDVPSTLDNDLDNNDIIEETTLETKTTNNVNKSKKERKITRKELFEELYLKYINESRKERKKRIVNEMMPYFKDKISCESYVQVNLERKIRNLICRRVRMSRKANLAHFNYFCTFTYDDKKHTEITFKKKLRTCFRHLCERRNWKYMGVWERAPVTNRLHFHGLFNIPNNNMPGELFKKKDFNFATHNMQETIQSSYFNDRFGRSDFKEIDENEKRLGNALAYLMKYIEKTGEKIVYSKGLPQYFISDIMDDDVVCTIGQEDKKLLLFDNFNCWDEGCLMGTVSEETISQMRKSN